MKKSDFYFAPEAHVIVCRCVSIACLSGFTDSVNESLDATEQSTDDIIFGW